MPGGIPLLRVAALRPVLRILVELGAPVERWARRVVIPPSLLQQPEALVPLHQVVRFLAVVAEAVARPDLGLLAGERARLDELGTYGRMVLRSRTFGDALTAVTMLSGGWTSGEEWRIERGRDEVRLHHRFVEPLDRGEEPAEHYTVALLLNLARLVAGRAWTPREVKWQTRATPAVGESSLFHGTRLTFSQPTSTVAFPVDMLERPLPKASAGGPDVSDVERWHSSRPPTDLAGSVRQVIVTATPRDAHPRIDTVAAALGVSIRTLQRRLSDGGLSFEQILKGMRFEMAADLLERTDARILDVALDLGYSDHAHFTRAFRQWTGLSPFEYRRRRREWFTDPAPMTA
jgi:AraC-like DNA-binding protein